MNAVAAALIMAVLRSLEVMATRALWVKPFVILIPLEVV
jgi:hypothetical protein